MRNLITKRPWLVAMSAMTIALMAVAFLAATSFTAQAAESKVGGLTSDEAVFVSDSLTPNGRYETIMEGYIQTSQWEDVVMDVSLECGLTTDTTVKSKHGSSDTARAEAGVMVKVLVDGVAASPHHEIGDPGVVYCSRMQEQTAIFGGVLEACEDLNDDRWITLDECTFTDEELRLVLDTMGAHSFNFFMLDLDQGEHFIEVQARIYQDTYAEAGSAVATATIGMGSVTIDEVKFVKGYNP